VIFVTAEGLVIPAQGEPVQMPGSRWPGPDTSRGPGSRTSSVWPRKLPCCAIPALPSSWSASTWPRSPGGNRSRRSANSTGSAGTRCWILWARSEGCRWTRPGGGFYVSRFTPPLGPCPPRAARAQPGAGAGARGGGLGREPGRGLMVQGGYRHAARRIFTMTEALRQRSRDLGRWHSLLWSATDLAKRTRNATWMTPEPPSSRQGLPHSRGLPGSRGSGGWPPGRRPITDLASAPSQGLRGGPPIVPKEGRR